MTRDEEVAAMDKDYDEMDFEEKSDYWEARSRRFEVANNGMRAGTAQYKDLDTVLSDAEKMQVAAMKMAKESQTIALDTQRTMGTLVMELQYIQKAILMAQGLSAGAAGTAEELTQKVNEVWDVMRTPF